MHRLLLNKKSQPGAALIITLLIVTVISAIALSVSQMLISEIKQITRFEDSEVAYQSAESGIETGLLFYRYNKNIEIPSNNTGGLGEDDQKFLRIRIDKGEIIDSNQFMDTTKQYYDLKIWHKNSNSSNKSVEKVDLINCKIPIAPVSSYPKYCIDNPTTGKKVIPALAKDASVEYDLNGTVANIYLKWKYLDSGHALTDAEINSLRLEYTAYDENNNIVAGGAGKNLFTYQESLNSQSGDGLVLVTNGAKTLRIRPWGGDLENYQISLVGTNDKLDSRYTYVESTGYFSTSKRRLKVQIDRATGSIVTSYDFVINTPESISGSK